MTSNQASAVALRGKFEQKSIVSAISGRDVSEFGTVRPRVQIPGPRPFLYSKSAISGVVWSQRHTAGSNFLRSNQTEAAPDAEFQARSALAIAPALWLAFLSSSRNSPEIWPVEAVMSGAGYRASSQSRQR